MKQDANKIEMHVEMKGMDEAVSKAEQLAEAIKTAISLADELAAVCRELRIEVD